MTERFGKPDAKGGRITLFHVIVVALSMTLTLGAWLYSSQQVERRNMLRFEAARDQVLGLITDRMARYEEALWAGVAAIESHDGSISYQDWTTFAENLRIDERYPGINGIGVIHFLDEDQLGVHLAEQRVHRPDFTVFPDHANELRMPITYIVPEDINAAAVGLDVAHETNRRNAALASRDSGTAQITGPIVLVQDEGRTSGFLFYAPFYSKGPLATLAERREHARGAVYAPFVVHKLMEGLLAKELRTVLFSIRDGENLIYDEHSGNDPRSDPEPMFSEEVAIELYGRRWSLDLRTDRGFRVANTTEKPTLILVAGLLIEALIVSLLYHMSQANRHAMNYADKVTVALREEKSKLEDTNLALNQKNEELERFAYVASHDLKTPIRGINGLTEMIQEDLGEYLSSRNSNPQVANNLGRIRERVTRMEALTDGIMKFSRTGVLDQSADPVSVERVVSDTAFDLGLTSSQWTLSGGSQIIELDPTHFRTVLENLISNAVKYHDGNEELKIDIKAVRHGGILTTSVIDNGPGIDTEHHDRVFEVFQTLRTPGSSESTGIGLSIVRKAVERHGGRVWLSSSKGQGATFSFEWPVHRDSSSKNAMEAAA